MKQIKRFDLSTNNVERFICIGTWNDNKHNAYTKVIDSTRNRGLYTQIRYCGKLCMILIKE